MDRVEWWNRRAPGFNARHGERKGGGSFDVLLEMIHRSGFVNPGTWMLDIGCGPGNYAIPLAERFEKVVALDASPKMLSILEERAGAMGIRNIETVCMSWEDVDLDKLNWRGRFGLVAAIKSPGIGDLKTLRKMIEASISGCFYSGFIMREDSALADIWRMVFQEEKPPVPADPFYIYHLVHALGYLPAFELRRYVSKSRADIVTAKEELALMMAPYEDTSGLMTERISGYVNEKSFDGIFERTFRSEEGSILWSVK
jgi:SAM-dependent methyltransferase